MVKLLSHEMSGVGNESRHADSFFAVVSRGMELTEISSTPYLAELLAELLPGWYLQIRRGVVENAF